MHPKIEFTVHPNAPVVINRYVERNGRRTYNRNAWRAKYSSRENAQWLCDTMNRTAGDGGTVWYVAGEGTLRAPLGNTPTAAAPTTAPAGVCVTYANGARSFHPGFSMKAGHAFARSRSDVSSVRDFEIRNGRRVIIA
jgi:hypothetical protein